MAFEIKDEFKDERVGFNNSAEVLGKRTDLHLLAEAALHGNGSVKDKHVINYFKSVPTLDEIKSAKEKSFQEKQDAKPASLPTAQLNNGSSAAK